MSTHMTTQTEHAWMDEAIEVATANVNEGGGPFGALIVRGGEVLATGANRVTSELDPTAHAEINAMRAACRELGTFALDGCVLVTSCEPCPMCLTAALWARVDRILYAADRDDAAAAGFDDRAFYEALRDPAKRPVPLEQVATPRRNAAFHAWRASEDRIDY